MEDLVKLQHCRRCGSGNVLAQLVSGQGENVSITEIGKRQADPGFVQNLELVSHRR